MKKMITLLIFFCIVLQTIPFSRANDTSLETKTLNYSFSSPVFSEKNGKLEIDVPETNSEHITSSSYTLPFLKKQITFPFDTIIESIDYDTKHVQSLIVQKSPQITPEPHALSKMLSETSETMMNEFSIGSATVYSIKSWLQYEIGAGLKDNQQVKILTLYIYPVLYDPDAERVRWIEQISIDINYSKPQRQQLSTTSLYELLILSPDEFSDELDRLVTHKIQQNRSTKLVTLNDITDETFFPIQGRDMQENIKYFIKKAIEEWGTSFVFLIGSSDMFPTRKTHVHIQGDSETFVSDLYYADIYNETGSFSSWDTNNNDIFAEYDWGMEERTDELDLYPDVFLGRAACINEEQVQTIVDKIIMYETEEMFTQNWFNNITVVGGDSFPSIFGDDSGINEGELVNEEVIKRMEGFIPTKIWDSNGVLSGLNPTGVASINNAINAGCGFVDFSGHGGSSVWTTYPHNGTHQILPTPTGAYRDVEIGRLTNKNKLPIVITGACSVGKFDQDDNCFSWSFLANPDGGGIASVGATGYGYAYIGKWVTSGLIEKMTLNMFDAFQDGANTFGEMWGNAIVDYISWRMDATDYKTILEWQPFGDPSLRIASDSIPPLTPDAPKGKSAGRFREEYSYETNTTDPDEDEIYYLFDWGNNEFSGWLGPYDSGETVQAYYSWEKKGEYQIRVKAKDEHGQQSDWSEPTRITMPNRNIISPVLWRLIGEYPLIQSFFHRLTE